MVIKDTVRCIFSYLIFIIFIYLILNEIVGDDATVCPHLVDDVRPPEQHHHGGLGPYRREARCNGGGEWWVLSRAVNEPSQFRRKGKKSSTMHAVPIG